SAYAGEDVGPGTFPLDAAAFGAPSLAAFAAATAREGCVGETVSAIVAAEQLAAATDPAVRAVLTEIAADEARHAELAWRAVAWALEVGGQDVRAAVAEVLRSASRHAPEAGDVLAPAQASARPEVLEAHGRLARRAARATVAHALDDVVRPCAARLVGTILS
ncbi:MAG TPA: ferritin-like domain-containing protein, partial [Minicystis sp.]|nr:ferritin-like domain-containing protein [Minicystis sp.]